MYADFNFLEKDNIIYSVDMLRLKTKITYSDFSKIEFKLKSIYSKFIKDFYISNSISSFKYNYNIELKEGCSYWFGFLHNSETINNKNSLQNDNTKYNFTIEFNPNKVPINSFLLYILSIGREWVIKSLDIAIDMKINIMDLCRP